MAIFNSSRLLFLISIVHVKRPIIRKMNIHKTDNAILKFVEIHLSSKKKNTNYDN